MKNFRKFESIHKLKALNESYRNFQSLHSIKQRKNQHSKTTTKNNVIRNVLIYLFYKKHKIVLKVCFGLTYVDLVEKLYEEIIKIEYEKNGSMEQAIKNVEKILGFSTQCKNLKEDYLLSIGKGKVTRSLLLECFMAKKNKNNILNYQIYNCLAIGGFSKVYLIRSRQNGQFYALKVIKKKTKPDSHDNASTIINQMKICENLNHPFLVKLYEGFQTQNFYCMVFQYCPGGQLFYLLKRIKCIQEASARFYFIQILLAIEFLHENLIIYRDLKPENILIDWQGNAKLVDFGLSKIITSSKQKTYSYCGSAEYMAPEMILRCGHSFSIDYYSLGALLYQLVTGLPPFYTKDPIALQESIINEEVNFPSHLNLSSEIKDLLSRLLIKNQKYRLGSYAGIKEIKFHPWVGKFNTEEIKKKRAQCPFPPNLYEHNFDEEELGDDEEEFTASVFEELQTKKNTNIKIKIHCASKISREEHKNLLQKIRERLEQEENKENRSLKKSNLKISNQSFSKIKKSQLKKKTIHVSPKKQSQIIQKLLPYFNNTIVKNKSPKKFQRKKNFRIKQNKILNEPNELS